MTAIYEAIILLLFKDNFGTILRIEKGKRDKGKREKFLS
jgi:hypothetical protein